MNNQSNVSDFPANPQEPLAPSAAVRPLYWSVRRELWENRSVYLVPLSIAALMLLAFFANTLTLPHRLRSAGADAAKVHALITHPFDASAGVPIAIAFVVGVFYCLDALYAERRDRSILFWKSLPVSDRTTVLSKIAIPLVVLPLIVLSIVLTMQLFMVVTGSVVLSVSGIEPAEWLGNIKIFQRFVAFVYAMIAIALWHAPIYSWLLLVSGWARRAAFLWAVLPILAVGAVERMVAGSTHILALVVYRVSGWFHIAFEVPPRTPGSRDPLRHLTPLEFLTTPGLWLGLVFAAVCLVLAVRLRQSRDPI